MRLFLSLLVIVSHITNLNAQQYILPLWPEGVPNAQPSGEKELIDTADIVRISYVQDPSIAVFLPSKKSATGHAVIICPGGGYRRLAYDWEGTDVAKWLNGKGIAAIVLKYRLPNSASNLVPHKSPLMDAQQAMKRVKEHAKAWNIDPAKVGIMGFSAGGHLASTLGTHFDEENRPGFMVLIYPVITMKQPHTHSGSRTNLLGDSPSEELVEYYSNETQVKPDTPPTFIVHSADDQGVPVENSLMFFQALKDRNIPVEMHIYPYGGHGYSLAIGKGHLSSWPDRFIQWLHHLE